MKELKRWATTNKIFWLVLGLVVFFGFLDSHQIVPFHVWNSVEGWDLYLSQVGPMWLTIWVVFIAVIGLVYYWLVKDKSEATGIVAAGWIMLWAGVEDVAFFIFSRQPVTQCMQWFNDSHTLNSYVSTYLLGETCTSPLALYLTAALGLVAAYWVFKKLKVAKW